MSSENLTWCHLLGAAFIVTDGKLHGMPNWRPNITKKYRFPDELLQCTSPWIPKKSDSISRIGKNGVNWSLKKLVSFWSSEPGRRNLWNYTLILWANLPLSDDSLSNVTRVSGWNLSKRTSRKSGPNMTKWRRHSRNHEAKTTLMGHTLNGEDSPLQWATREAF